MIYFNALREGIVLPSRASVDDSSFDITMPESLVIPPMKSAWIKSGLNIVIPHGHIGIFTVRTSVAQETNLQSNSGNLHPNYPNEILIGLWNPSDKPIEIRAGDRLIQLVVVAVCTQTTVSRPRCLNNTENRIVGSTGLRAPLTPTATEGQS